MALKYNKNGVYFASDISRGGGGGPKWEISNPYTNEITTDYLHENEIFVMYYAIYYNRTR